MVIAIGIGKRWSGMNCLKGTVLFVTPKLKKEQVVSVFTQIARSMASAAGLIILAVIASMTIFGAGIMMVRGQ